jgi:hypothetical protein
VLSSPIEWTSSVADGTDRAEQADDPVLIAAARHALHDEEVVAAFAVDGDEAEDGVKARALIERCATCRDLHADLVAIGSTIRAVRGANGVATGRSAPRDFRLTPMDAARLHPGNAFRRAAARVFAGAAMFGRPIGASLAALGVVGLLVGTFGLGPLTATTAPQSQQMGAGGTETARPGAAATFDAFGAPPPASQTDERPNLGPAATGGANKEPVASDTRDSSPGRPGTIDVLLATSILVVGLGLAFLVAGIRHARAWSRPRHRT